LPASSKPHPKPTKKSPRAIIIGGGPAGLTAAYELLERSDISPTVFEAGDNVGGISRTFHYKGNHIDLGGHRFFSKSDRVMDWWLKILPIHSGEATLFPDTPVEITYQNQSRKVDPATTRTDDSENCMLVRSRVSRILFRGKLFDYPLSFNFTTISNLGFFNTALAGLSYIRARLFPLRPEKTLEQFVINRFGRYLYGSFFRDYTHKVWGVPCTEIPADWGAQRIKGVSISGLLKHALKKMVAGIDSSYAQKSTETSLIERFLYPKYGPGHMWERVSEIIREKGGEVEINKSVVAVETAGNRIIAVQVADDSGETTRIEAEWFFSTMPIKDLIAGMTPSPPSNVREVADGLPYRDFLTVGLLLDHLSLRGGISADQLKEKLPDNWIYIQEPDVEVGRLQVFNNWSPYLVSDPGAIWIGLEYFLNETDKMWNDADKDIIAFAIGEMEKLGFLVPQDVRDGVVIRQKKAYPAYFGSYKQIGEVQAYLSGFENFFALGRNGQHRYNNQDHSMLTAMIAIDNILAGNADKENVWNVNAEEDYHEEK
jgi:protoporphyrinogen oxidase